MSTKVQIVFYSMYGHVYRLAEAMAEGVRSVEGVEVALKQVPETLPDDVLVKMGAVQARKAFAHIPLADVGSLPEADAIIFGTPTRFGNMCGQMRSFLDHTGGLWAKGALIGKVGSVFTSTATQRGTPTRVQTTKRHGEHDLLHAVLYNRVTIPHFCSGKATPAPSGGGTPGFSWPPRAPGIPGPII